MFAGEGIDVCTGTTLSRVTRDDCGYLAVVTRGGEPPELQPGLLIAAGRRTKTEGLNLDSVGVRLGEFGEVLVDEHQRSTNPRIWAVGSDTPRTPAVRVRRRRARRRHRRQRLRRCRLRARPHSGLPAPTAGRVREPNIAAVGLTDARAVNQRLRCTCRVLPLEHVPRALVNGTPRGLIKIVAERGTDRIVDGHAIAPNAGDVIAAGVFAVQTG